MYIFGTVLILIGCVSFLDNLGMLPGGFWGFFWPAFLIILGVSFLFRSRCKECRGKMWCCSSCKKEKESGK